LLAEQDVYGHDALKEYAMDPISLVVTALIAGATSAAKDTASQAVKDAYQGLKQVIIEQWKKNSNVEDEKEAEMQASIHLKNFTKQPENYQSMIKDELIEHIKTPDPKLLELSNALVELVKNTDPQNKIFNTNIKEAKGLQIGDNNNQTNTFNT
jgi:hypothetical protein